MKFKKIELARQTNFILALLLIHFVFFGYLANVYGKSELDVVNQALGERILFLYQVMFTQIEFTGASIFFGGAMIGVIDIAFILLFAIVFLMVFRERFFEYGIRNSIWLVPFIIIQTWIWYWFITESFDISIIWGYFTRIESYITILTLLGTNILAAILGAIARERYNVFISRIKKIEV